MTAFPESQPPRRARLSSAELRLGLICLLGLLLLGVGAWISQHRVAPVQGAVISQEKWRLSQPRSRMASALVGDTLWVLGGIGGSGLTRPDGETFDLSVSPTRNLVGLLSSTSLLPRCDQTAEVFGSCIYLVGGQSGPGMVLNTLERLDTRTGLVSLLAPMPTARRMAHSVIYQGKIYVVGGSDGQARRLNTLEIYDIATNTWTRGAPMRVPRECDVALWKGQLIVAGGYDRTSVSGGVLQDVESYDIAAHRWRRMRALCQPISAHHAVVSGDWVFLFGDFLTLSRVIAFNPRTGESRELSDCGFLPRRHVVADVYNGRAYVCGGSTDDARSPLDKIQVFDLKLLRKMAESR